jgi:hypothetical protein
MQGTRSYTRIYLLLVVMLAGAVVASAGLGAFRFTPAEMLRYLFGQPRRLPATMLVYKASTSFGKVNLFTLLLAGSR